MKVLFVDHIFHLKTHSADFFLDILREAFEVETFYYENTYRFKIPQKIIDGADIIIFWEFLYNRRELGIPEKRCIFVPMYDNEWGSKWQWKRIAASGMPVISFCDAITRHAKAQGVRDILDIRYFPNPADFPQTNGDAKRVFLWERGEINEPEARRILPSDAGFCFDVKKANEFLGKQEYLERLAKSEIVIAPRCKEGIGMAFLEAMAMGKCVVAHDDATMNEYIKDGETGILIDFRKPAKLITANDVSVVRRNIAAAANKAHARWLTDKEKINSFVESVVDLPPLRRVTISDSFRYALFIIEGLMQRIGLLDR